MSEILSKRTVARLAGLELNALVASEVVPTELYEKTRITSAGTPIYDLNGELLFYRSPLRRGREVVGYSDVAANPALGAPLLGTSYGAGWNERALKAEAAERARKRMRSLEFDSIRFVAYSYPKIAAQFRLGRKEVMLLELYTWKSVPRASRRERKALEPSNFERWSLLDEMPTRVKSANSRKFQKRLAVWEESLAETREIEYSVISPKTLEPLIKAISLVDRRELHYSTRNSDHYTCYELRGQETNVWCVGASCQMLLDFYRYEYTQTRLAQALGLGTKANPNGLPYARVGDVVTQLELLSSNALDVTMITNPGWSTFRSEIRANRPLISFVPGHSRTVVGYTRSLIAMVNTLAFRGLLVYDPWPPNAGVVTRWENFDTQTYQYAYTAVLPLV